MTQGARILLGGENLGLIAGVSAALTLLCSAVYLLPPIRRFRQRAREKLERLAAEPPEPRKGAYMPTAAVMALLALTTGAVFAAGYVFKLAAIEAAYEERVGNMDDVSGPCHACRTYWTKTSFVVGIPLFQSDTALYVFDRNFGVRVIRISELQSDELFLPKIHTREAEAKLIP